MELFYTSQITSFDVLSGIAVEKQLPFEVRTKGSSRYKIFSENIIV